MISWSAFFILNIVWIYIFYGYDKFIQEVFFFFIVLDNRSFSYMEIFLENWCVDCKRSIIRGQFPVRVDEMVVVFQRVYPKEYKINHQIGILLIIQISNRKVLSRSGQF